MGKKSTPKAPAAPDPVATANAQAAANKEAAIAQSNINRIDQYTPQGSIKYTQNGTWADGTPRYTQTMSYSTEQQALYDQENQIAQALGGLAANNIDRVAEVQSKPFTYDNMTPAQSVRSNAGDLQSGTGTYDFKSDLGNAGSMTTGVQTRGQQGNIANAGSITRGTNTYDYQGNIKDAGALTRNVQPGNVQQSLNYSNLSALPDGSSFNEASKAAANAVYNQAASRLDPQYAQLERQMRDRLINSGISENSEAYRRAMDDFGRQRTDAYNQANYSSIGAGLAAQQQGYGQALSTRQQGVSEINTQGQFANAAQQQRFDQGMANANLNNTAQQTQFSQNAAQRAAYNEAQAAKFAQAQQNAALNNSGQQQQFAQNQAQLEAYNAAQQNRFTQDVTNADIRNTAQQQQFAQNQARVDAFNAAQTNRFAQAQQNAALNNQTASQAFNTDLAAANQNNQLRQQEIEEATYLRNLPINDIAALLGTGGTVQQPQFSDFAQAGIAAPDYQGAVYANYNGAMQQYNAQMQARSQGLGSIFGLAGSLGSAAIMSDRRIKHSIKKIGELASGIGTYLFSYIGSTKRHFGVMAQEVLEARPDAVGVMPNGTLYVKYGKVW